MNLEEMMSDLISGIDIKPFGPLRKGKKIIALPTAFGTKRRIHGCTKNVMMISYEWETGGMMPNHEHDVEQISYVLEGKVKVTIGDESFIAEKGDSYTEPKRIGHSMEALEPSMTLEVFAPPRPLFLVLEAAASHDVHGAFENLKKGVEASKKKK
ncbi:cupin domain-containing protein [Chloroflexota bacterium]